MATYLAEHPNTDTRALTRLGPSPWLRGSAIVDDSLIGHAGVDNPPDRRAIALVDITRLEARSTSLGRTAALVGGTVALGTLIALVFIGSTEATY
jgi:hypothetical protein